MKNLFAGFILVGCVFVFGNTAYSLPTSGQDAILSRTGTFGGASGGGEFLVDIYDNNQNVSVGQYVSFCLEYNEYITLSPARYNIRNVSDYAELGGGGAVDNKDYLSNQTKWLFWNYLYGSDDNIRRNGDDARANDVQQVIWYLEEEWGYNSLSLTAKTIVSYVNSKNDFTTGGGIVKALNLEDRYGNYKQTQLIAEPIPEPAIMLLFGTGLVGLTTITRRRNKKQ